MSRVNLIELVEVFVIARIVVLVVFLDLGQHFVEARRSNIWSLPPLIWPESIIKRFDLEQSLSLRDGFVESIFDQTQGQLFVSDQDRHAGALLLLLFLQLLPVPLQFFLIDCSDVTEPASVRLNPPCCGIGRTLFHLCQIGFRSVHVQSVYRGLGSELRSRLPTGRVRSVRIRTRRRFLEGRPWTGCRRRLSLHVSLVLVGKLFGSFRGCLFGHVFIYFKQLYVRFKY